MGSEMVPAAHTLNARLLRYRSHPDQEDARALAHDLLNAHRYGDARGVAVTALGDDGEDVSLLVLEGRAWLMERDLLRAQAALVRAARADRERAETFRWLGEVLLARGDVQRATRALERVLSLDPEDARARELHQRALRLVVEAEARPFEAPAAPLPPPVTLAAIAAPPLAAADTLDAAVPKPVPPAPPPPPEELVDIEIEPIALPPLPPDSLDDAEIEPELHAPSLHPDALDEADDEADPSTHDSSDPPLSTATVEIAVEWVAETEPVAEAESTADVEPVAEAEPVAAAASMEAEQPAEAVLVGEVEPIEAAEPIAEAEPALEAAAVAELAPALEAVPVAELAPVLEAVPVAEVDTTPGIGAAPVRMPHAVSGTHFEVVTIDPPIEVAVAPAWSRAHAKAPRVGVWATTLLVCAGGYFGWTLRLAREHAHAAGGLGHAPAPAATLAPHARADAERTRRQAVERAAVEGAARARASSSESYAAGRVLRAKGDLGGAEAAYREALAAWPGHVAARRALGGVLLDAGRYADADAVYAELLAQAEDVAARLGRVEALVALGRGADAQAQMEAVPDAGRDAASVREAGARLALTRGLPGDAVALLEPLVGARTRSAPLLALYGHALYRVDRVNVAAWAFERALALDPASPEALMGRAEVHLRAERPGDALALLDRAEHVLARRALAPDWRARMYALVGRAYVERRGAGDRDQAVLALQKALALPRVPAETYFWLGEALGGRNTPPASDAFKRYLELDPTGRYADRAKRALGPLL